MNRDALPTLAPEVLARLGRPLAEPLALLLSRYVEYLLAANARMNLTSVRDRAGIQQRHIAESLALLQLLERHALLPAGGALLDVGSGGGLPGIPMAIARPDARVTLLEATGKKAAFLQEVAGGLALANVSVLAARAEEAAHLPAYRERYDVAVARAVASLDTLAELTLPFVRTGGRVLAVKGSRWQEELRAASAAIITCGGGAAGAEPLPGDEEGPLVAVWLKKVRRTPRAYPRRPGLPGRQPLR